MRSQQVDGNEGVTPTIHGDNFGKGSSFFDKEQNKILSQPRNSNHGRMGFTYEEECYQQWRYSEEEITYHNRVYIPDEMAPKNTKLQKNQDHYKLKKAQEACEKKELLLKKATTKIEIIQEELRKKTSALGKPIKKVLKKQKITPVKKIHRFKLNKPKMVDMMQNKFSESESDGSDLVELKPEEMKLNILLQSCKPLPVIIKKEILEFLDKDIQFKQGFGSNVLPTIELAEFQFGDTSREAVKLNGQSGWVREYGKVRRATQRETTFLRRKFKRVKKI